MKRLLSKYREGSTVKLSSHTSMSLPLHLGHIPASSGNSARQEGHRFIQLSPLLKMSTLEYDVGLCSQLSRCLFYSAFLHKISPNLLGTHFAYLIPAASRTIIVARFAALANTTRYRVGRVWDSRIAHPSEASFSSGMIGSMVRIWSTSMATSVILQPALRSK